MVNLRTNILCIFNVPLLLHLKLTSQYDRQADIFMKNN